ncbi:MAG: ribbon-helix-helix protein, CopG family [Acidobacteriia bacterium]|nr:ribbon-helix-helix protein, CopG family [Terriglobia bacterium]
MGHGAQKKSLEKLSAKTGAPVAALMRRAIDNYLTMREKQLR